MRGATPHERRKYLSLACAGALYIKNVCEKMKKNTRANPALHSSPLTPGTPARKRKATTICDMAASERERTQKRNRPAPAQARVTARHSTERYVHIGESRKERLDVCKVRRTSF